MILAWILLGGLHCAAFWPLDLGGVTALIIISWSAGLVLLLRDRRRAALPSAVRRLLDDRGVRIAVQLHFGLWGLSIYLFGFGATLLLFTVVAAAAFLAVSLRREALLRESVIGSALLGTVLFLLFATAELFLRIPDAVATRLGTPEELDAWDERYDGLWRSNILGFRSPYEHVHRRPGVPRVVALGDSFTWGDKVAETDSTWPAHVERILRRELQIDAVEVINMAQRGYTLANEAELLRRLGWQFSPDLVVVQFYINDALPSGPNLQRVDSRWLFPPRSLLPGFAHEGAIGSSAALTVLDRTYNRVLGRFRSDRSPSKWEALYRDGSETWRQFETALREMGDSAGSRAVPIYLVMFPDFKRGTWTTSDYPFRQVYEKVAATAADAGFKVIDLVPTFVAAGLDWSTWWATPYDAHPGPAAQRLAAETIARELLADGTLGLFASTGGPSGGDPERARGPGGP